MTVAAHDPGGKVRTVLTDGVVGDAEFHGHGDCYRPWLSREWTELDQDYRPGFLLWIGMNPSTADAKANDPTIRRETFFTRREGYRRFLKCNVMDYRATHPRDLLAVGIEPRSALNLPTIERHAAGAAMIICAWGALHPRLRHFADETETMLRSAGHKLFCLGLTEGLAPRHPLYVRGDAPFLLLEETK